MHGQVQVQVLGRVTPNLVDEHFPLCTCTPIDGHTLPSSVTLSVVQIFMVYDCLMTALEYAFINNFCTSVFLIVASKLAVSSNKDMLQVKIKIRLEFFNLA